MWIYRDKKFVWLGAGPPPGGGGGIGGAPGLGGGPPGNPGKGGGGGAGGGAAFGFVDITTRDSIFAPSIGFTPAFDISEGELIVVIVAVGNSSLLTWTIPSGFTEQQYRRSATGDNVGLLLWTKVATASEPTSYTFSHSGTSTTLTGGLAAYSGVSASPVADTNGAVDTNFNTASFGPGSLTLGVSGGFVGVCLAYNGDVDWVPDEAGMETRADLQVGTSRSFEWFDEVGISASTFSRTATPAASCRKVAVGLAMNEA